MWKRRLKALNKLTFIMIQQAWKIRSPFTLNFNKICEIGYSIHGNIPLQHIHTWLYYESQGSELSKIIWQLQQTLWNYLWEQRQLCFIKDQCYWKCRNAWQLFKKSLTNVANCQSELTLPHIHYDNLRCC